MSHFYGSIHGSRGEKVCEATRGGDKAGGYVSYTASWEGAVRVSLYHNEETGQDMASVSLVPWHGGGTTKPLYDGPVSGKRRKAGR